MLYRNVALSFNYAKIYLGCQQNILSFQKIFGGNMEQSFKERFASIIGQKKNVVLTKELGVSDQSIRNYLNEGKIPETKVLLRIQNCFDVSIDWLLTGLGPMKREQGQAERQAPEIPPALQEAALLLAAVPGTEAIFRKHLRAAFAEARDLFPERFPGGIAPETPDAIEEAPKKKRVS